MRRFSSKYNALIDDKGRVVLPVAFKRTLGDLAEEPIVVEKDVYKPCLNLYPQRYWDERLDRIDKKLNPFDERDDEMLAEIYENFTVVTMAPNGRINIPSDYLEYAGIIREVVFAGKGQSIVMWNEQEYYRAKQTRKPLRDSFSERLGNNPENEAQ